MEWTAVLVCVGVFLVFNAAAVCVFWAACVVLDQAENEFDESEGEGMSWSTLRALQVASDRIVKQEDQIQRALQVLQKAQRHHPENAGEMEACTQGEWIAISDVGAAIDILREGQQ